jgi:hypothetical protein
MTVTKNDSRTLLGRAAGMLGILASAESLEHSFLVGKADYAKQLGKEIDDFLKDTEDEEEDEEDDDDDYEDTWVEYEDDDDDDDEDEDDYEDTWVEDDDDYGDDEDDYDDDDDDDC